MGLLGTILRALSAGAGGLYEFIKSCNIFSDYNLCSSIPNENIVAQLSSLGTLSITDIRLVAQPSTVIGILNYLGSLFLYPSPTSTYNLSTAIT